MSSDPAFDASSKAKRQVESGNPKGAANTLEKYLITDPHNTKIRLQLAQVAIYDLDDYEYGMMQLDAVLDIDPEYVDAMIAQVTAMSKYKKKNRETDEKFQKILEVSPTADVYNLYAKFLRNQMTDFKKAAQYYEKAIALEPGRYEYHQNYAVLLLNDLKDYGKAKVELEAVLAVKPADPKIRKAYDRLLREKFDKDGNVKKRKSLFSRN